MAIPAFHNSFSFDSSPVWDCYEDDRVGHSCEWDDHLVMDAFKVFDELSGQLCIGVMFTPPPFDASLHKTLQVQMPAPIYDTETEEEEEDASALGGIHVSACKRATDDILKQLAAGIEGNRRDSEGSTPLHWAVDSGHLNAVKILGNDISVEMKQDSEMDLKLEEAPSCGAEIIVSPPVVPFRKTVLEKSCCTVMSKSPNKLTRIVDEPEYEFHDIVESYVIHFLDHFTEQHTFREPVVFMAILLPSMMDTTFAESLFGRATSMELQKRKLPAVQNLMKQLADNKRVVKEFQEGDIALLHLQFSANKSMGHVPGPQLACKFSVPFSTAARIHEDGKAKSMVQESIFSVLEKLADGVILWSPICSMDGCVTVLQSGSFMNARGGYRKIPNCMIS